MSEDREEVKNSEEREGLHDADRALKSIQRGKEEGKWSTPKPAYTGEPVPPQTEKQYPTQKEREETLAKMPGHGKETVPLKVREELTEETKRIHTMAMEGGEEKRTELPKVKPFIEEAQTPPPPSQAPEPISPQAGEKEEERISMKKILDAQKKIDEIKEGPAPGEITRRIKKRQAKLSEEEKKFILPSENKKNVRAQAGKPEAPPAPQVSVEAPVPEKRGFFSRLFGRKK